MTTLNNIPLAYISISLFCAGFTLYCSINHLYIFFRSQQRDFLYLPLISLSATTYIVCDFASIIIYALTSDQSIPRFFVLLRELTVPVFTVALIFMAGEVTDLKERPGKIHFAVFTTAIILSLMIIVISALHPETLTGSFTPDRKDILVISVIQNITPLLIFKTAFLIISLIYVLSILLYMRIFNRNHFPITKLIFSCAMLLYFIFSGIFYIIFLSGNGYISFYFPYVNFGITLVMLLNSFMLIDISFDFAKKFNLTEDKLKKFVYQDSGTEIPNRNSFLNDLKKELDSDNRISLIFIDIDDFQNINESYGEKTGDEILKLLALRLYEYFSSAGRLYRIGGDDFVLIANEFLPDEKSGGLADKIISSMRTPFVVFGTSYSITVSIGVLKVPQDGDNPNDILSNAYRVIRNAKKTKNTFRTFSGQLADISLNRIKSVNILRKSINSDQFELHYQPIVNRDGKLEYAEALIRCTNPDPSIESPGEFIPLLEKAGLMKDLDNMVIRKAFLDMEMKVKKKFPLSINLSSNQIINSSYIDFLSAFARQHRIEPNQVILEVIENSLIENLDTGRDIIQRLKDDGFKIAIDDFGKGFSSLSYLSELPVDIIKIDMAFIQSVPGDRRKEMVVSHIMSLAHSLDMKVVAEGFENIAQVEFFRKLGCDNFQGYYFSKPLQIHELMEKYSGQL